MSAGRRRPLADRPRPVGLSKGHAFFLRQSTVFHPGPWRIRALFATAAIILSVLLIWLRQSDTLREVRRREFLVHTVDLNAEVRAVEFNLLQAETAQRGYQSTGDAAFTEQFRVSCAREQAARHALRALVAGNRTQLARLDRIDRLAAAKVAALRLAMARRETVAASDDQLNDECARVLQDVETEELHLFIRYSAELNARGARIRTSLALGSGVVLLLFLVALVTIERDTRQRNRDRAALIASEDRLRLSLQAARAGSWEWDIERNESQWSDELWRLYELDPTASKATRDVWRTIVHPDDFAAAETAIDSAAREAHDVVMEYRVRRGSGGYRWILALGQAICNEDGRAVRYNGIALDITDRKVAEQALQQRERILHRFTEAAPVAIAIFDRSMALLAASKRFRDDYVAGRADLVGRNLYEILPQVEAKWGAVHRRCLEGAVESNPGERFPRPDGGEQWVRWEIQPWYEAEDRIGGIVLFSEDITEQRRAERELNESAARLQLAQRVAQMGSFEWDLEKQKLTWTPEMERLHGMESGSFGGAGSPWMDRIHPDDREGITKRLFGAPQGEAVDHEWRVIWPDGSLHWLTGRWRVLRDENGNPSRVSGMMMDITPRKLAEQALVELNQELELKVRERTAQLESANRELEAFAYSVSHDLRAPLRGIDGWSMALLEEYGQLFDETAHTYLGRVRSEAQRMSRLIDDLLHLSRITRAQIVSIPVDLTRVANAVAQRLREEFPDRQFDFRIAENLTAQGDERQLEIALTNLLGNAAKFTGPRPTATIEFERQILEGETVFVVRDNGVGFSMDYAKMLFAPFLRLHRMSEFPGTGIGLATVQRIVHRHGGRVWANAEVGRGATFYFTLSPSANRPEA